MHNLLAPSTPYYFNTLYDPYCDGADFVRGYPFSLREGVPTVVSHGLWLAAAAAPVAGSGGGAQAPQVGCCVGVLPWACSVAGPGGDAIIGAGRGLCRQPPPPRPPAAAQRRLALFPLPRAPASKTPDSSTRS
jgi:hypothetical protein